VKKAACRFELWIITVSVAVMGLDQYLHAKKYTTPSQIKGWEKKNEDFAKLVAVIGEDSKYLDDFLPSISIDMKVGYWRKSNAIHQWFVLNCQNGEDDCREAYVSREALEELRDTCKQVIEDNSKADELLPTQAGFFFGSTDYDEYYWEDLQKTIELCEKCLSMPDEWEFAYQSSW
jgi:hypothetical protein